MVTSGPWHLHRGTSVWNLSEVVVFQKSLYVRVVEALVDTNNQSRISEIPLIFGQAESRTFCVTPNFQTRPQKNFLLHK